jgi:hypothetical protein
MRAAQLLDMQPAEFGTQQVTDEDRGYQGSRFSEVRDALFANPYQRVWGGAGEPPLPSYDVTLLGVLRGILPLGARIFFARLSQERSIREPICVGVPTARVSGG